MKKSELNLHAAEYILEDDLGGLKANVKKGANINAKCYADRYPLLLLAVMKRNVEMVKYLLSANADPNACQKHKFAVLMSACIHGQNAILGNPERIVVAGGVENRIL